MLDQKSKKNLAVQDDSPLIPEKLYFTIGEVSELCQLRPHVLRYWEQEFSQLTPMKRRGNRRYYQRKDVILICKIKNLLYEQGFTIEGARQQLATEQMKENPLKQQMRGFIKQMLNELDEAVAILETKKV